jgi:hypothetical protein
LRWPMNFRSAQAQHAHGTGSVMACIADRGASCPARDRCHLAL